MCLAIPGEIIEILDAADASALRVGRVSFAGLVKQVCLVYVPDAAIGDHVLVHAGFAIAQIGEDHARETLAYLTAMTLDGDEP